MNATKQIAAAFAAMSLAGAPLADAMAQQSAPPPAGPLEEVVVSAFRRTSEQDLGASITVLDAVAIDAAALQHFEELVALVPNMNYSGDGSRARYFQLRGIGELEQYEGAPNPSIGFIVDDIDLSGIGGVNATFDLRQLEVLRGPQATRFGASALAGLVYIQSADPTGVLASHAEALVGSDGALGAGAALGGPLGAAFAGRLAVHHYRSDGFYDNVALGTDDSNAREETTLRGKLRWDIATGWEAKLSLLHADFDNGYDAWSPENGRITYSDNPGRDRQRTTGASLRVSGPLGAGAEIVSITAGARSDILFSFDGEWGDAGYWAPYGYDYVYSDTRDRDALSQELRLVSTPGGRLFGGRSDWVLGLYAQRLEETDDIVSRGLYDDSADAPFSYCVPCLDDTTLTSDYQARNLAAFGRLDSALGERWSLNLGLRVERWEADYEDAFIDWIYGDPEQPLTNEFDPADTLWGGDVGLEYAAGESLRLYGLVSRGYKAGGFNPSLARALGGDEGSGRATIAFDSEHLVNFELGLKGQWLEGRLNAAAGVFYMDRGDMQLRSSAQFTDNPNDFIFITSNAEGHAWGLEATASWQLTDRWRLHAAAGLLRSAIDAYELERESGITGELVGRDFAHAPPWTLNLGASYAGPGGWVGRIDFNAAGSYYFDYSHDQKADDRRVMNLRLGREWARWALYGWVRNLFDEDYYTRGFYFGLAPPDFPSRRYTRLGDPRHYGVTLTYRY